MKLTPTICCGACALSALAILLISGCNRMPTRKQARALFNKRQAKLAQIEKALRAELETFPYAGPRYKCKPLPGVAAPHHRRRCEAAFGKWKTKAVVADRAFRKRSRSHMLDIKGVKGVQVHIVRKTPMGPFEVPQAGTKPMYRQWLWGCNGNNRANKKGSTPPKKGFTVGKYRVGWGLGQLSFDAGEHKYKDGSYFKQLDVVWSFRVKELHVRVEVNLLATDNPPNAWRQAARAHCRK